MRFYASAALALLATASASDSMTFDEWAAKFNKVYASPEERAMRAEIYARNMEIAREYNAREEHFTLGANKFADVSSEEYTQRYGRRLRQSSRPNLRSPAGRILQKPTPTPAPFPPPPSSVDWTNMGPQFVRPPIDTGPNCNAAWAFAVTGAVEAAWMMKTGNFIPGSIQELLECMDSFNDDGCTGPGDFQMAFVYIHMNGLVSEARYPYEGEETGCDLPIDREPDMYVDGINFIDQLHDWPLYCGVSTRPTLVQVETISDPWRLYTGGIITSPVCGNSGDVHTMGLAVGYGIYQGIQYWKVRMDYGTSWGEGGYVRIKRDPAANYGFGICGIYHSSANAYVL